MNNKRYRGPVKLFDNDTTASYSFFSTLRNKLKNKTLDKKLSLMIAIAEDTSMLNVPVLSLVQFQPKVQETQRKCLDIIFRRRPTRNRANRNILLIFPGIRPPRPESERSHVYLRIPGTRNGPHPSHPLWPITSARLAPLKSPMVKFKSLGLYTSEVIWWGHQSSL